MKYSNKLEVIRRIFDDEGNDIGYESLGQFNDYEFDFFKGYIQGRRSVLTELLTRDWWNSHQRIVLEDWLRQECETIKSKERSDS